MILRILIFVIVLIVFVSVALPSIINRAMFPVPEPSYTWQMPSVVNIGTDDAPVAALWIANPKARKVILFSHGNGEDIGMGGGFYELFASGVNASVLVYDYPGYGLTAGKPSEKGVYKTAEAAYRFLVEEKKFALENIIVMGRSIGGGPSCYLAKKYPVGGLILESTFTSAVRVVTGARVLPFDPFSNVSRIGRIKCPKLIIHGTEDEVIPFSHGKKLAAVAAQPCRFVEVEGAGHNDLFWIFGEKKYIKLIKDFIDTL